MGERAGYADAMLERIALVLVLAALPAFAQRGEVVVEGLRLPVDMAFDPTDASRIYVVEQGGRIRVIESGTLRPEPFFEVKRTEFVDQGWEQGLLGLAFDPGYEQNRRFYINYTTRRGATRISRVTVPETGRPTPEHEEVLLTIDQPYANHNGGCIRFGPDGMLYIGMGDGGAAGDPHGHGQRLNSLLGKLLRIDVTGEPGEGKKYAVPEDNPFVGREGVRPEIWSYGLRNPWKFEFDSRGRMWIADVGQNKFEWIHLQREGSRGGENYGWNILEGEERFTGGPEPAADFLPTLPVWVYTQRSNGGNGSVTGGFLYEGTKVEPLKGRYVYADFMSGRIWSFRLGSDGKADDVAEITSKFASLFADREARALTISGFGRDAEGELYMIDHKHGRVIKIVP